MTRLSGYLDADGVFHTPQNKYGARRTELGGRVYDSKREADRAVELQLLERMGEIRDLRYQVRFALTADGQLIGHYVADFTFEEPVPDGWCLRVEDVKSPATAKNALYRWKRRHMRAEHGIEIRET